MIARLVELAVANPRAFNFYIMANYAMACGWWALQGKWADACYWASALAITATVTFGYRH